MPKPHIFVSCGQRTYPEKQLAGEICQAIKSDGRFDFFFAEFQHSLHGLNENILDALSDAVGFVTVLHGRGQVSHGDPPVVALTRASVWIEQEIAIAAFIQRTTKKPMLTAAYIEEGVGREGIRDLLHLNPTVFKTNEEVIGDLKNRLAAWQASQSQSRSEDEYGKLELRHTSRIEANIGRIVHLNAVVTNRASRVKEYSCTLEVPNPLLLAWSGANYYIEVQGAGRTGYRLFRVTEDHLKGAPILKDQESEMIGLDVSITDLAEPLRSQVLEQPIFVTAELGEHSYELSIKSGEAFHLPAASA